MISGRDGERVRDISSTINRFANSFDMKDWDAMAFTLAEQIVVDYQDLRGTEGTVSRDEYVSARRSALEKLDTHHLLTNLEIHEHAGVARCRASGLIFRARGDRYFNSHVIYDFELAPGSSGWEITFIRQRVLWHEGDPGLHSGAKQGEWGDG